MTKRMTAEDLATAIISNIDSDRELGTSWGRMRDGIVSIIKDDRKADRKATLEAAAERMRSWYNKQEFIFSKDTFYALFTAILRDEEH
jgi:hypothetical protein